MREESVPHFLSPSHSELPLPLTRNQVTSRGREKNRRGAPEFRNGALGTGGQGQPRKAGVGAGGREPLTTPLPAVQLPRQRADPPPTSHGASARVPIP